MSQTNEIDLLYATSVGFLIVITISIVAALFSYNKSKLNKLKTWVLIVLFFFI